MFAKLLIFLKATFLFLFFYEINPNFVGKSNFILMKRVLSVVFVLLASRAAFGQMKWNANHQAYINQYYQLAVREMHSYGIPASITLAQGIFESGAGQSELARKGNNHFGIKCHGWTGRTVYHDDDAAQECFRAYNSVLESYEDHSKFLANSQRYRRLFALGKTDYKGWARGLKECGYATNPQYADKLIQLIELYQLHQYDNSPLHAPALPQSATANGVRQPQPTGTHSLYIYNDNVYLRARQGETFKTLAKETGISYKKLARYNELDKNTVLREGDVIYLNKKKTKADHAFKNYMHTISPGESMYSIAQSYGIRLKSLYSKNHLPADYRPRVGDQLRVY